MKRTLAFMVMAFALLLTQCRKPEVKFPTASEGVTVSMTVTAGPGSKTDITTMGGIVWSENDKIYVGDGSKYVGYLTIVSGVGTPTGTFSGDVTLTGIPEGTPQTFHFFYLGSVDYTGSLKKGESTTVDVDFSSQNIYNNGGNLENASKHHVGYGTANGTIANGVVTGVNVTLVSKVALARFRFTESDSKNDYTGALMLGGEHIYNKMTVNFGSSEGFAFTPAQGYISLTNTTSAEKYVMLVPTGSTEAETLNFVVGATGTTTLENGIEANKFYGRESAIAVTVKPVEFTVGMDGETPRKVKFAPGNLYWDGGAFRFEANQWDTKPAYSETEAGSGAWDASHVSHFKWSDAANAVTGNTNYNGDLFCASNFTVTGDSHTDWRTLTKDEWCYLLGIGDSYRANASDLRAEKSLDDGAHKGLVILPDGTKNPSTVLDNMTSTDALATSGAVFLPAAGYRDGTDMYRVGSYGYYWSSSPDGDDEVNAYDMYFDSGSVLTVSDYRDSGSAVRLVR